MTSILALGKAVPAYSLDQFALAQVISDLMQLSDEEAWILERIYKNSAISRRYSVVPDIMHPKTRFCQNPQSIRKVGMSERNQIYKTEAPNLAEKAARGALKDWGGKFEDITHVISVSCTGIMSPGIEYLMTTRLNLRSDVSLLGINQMGCFGAFKALKVANKIAKENPSYRILLVSTELCTLHFKPQGDMESIVIQSLFADGSAAAILGGNIKSNEQSLFKIEEEHSHLIKNTLNEMTWDAGDQGFDMTLSEKVPALIGEHLVPFVRKFNGFQAEAWEWAIHPGGKSILESAEKVLKLDRSQTISSWNVLKEFGNLSSATFLYVLEDICKRKESRKNIIGLGFGPGLSIEGLSLTRNKSC